MGVDPDLHDLLDLAALARGDGAPIPPSLREIPSTIVSIIQPMAAFCRSASRASSGWPDRARLHLYATTSPPRCYATGDVPGRIAAIRQMARNVADWTRGIYARIRSALGFGFRDRGLWLPTG